jgi:signal transduction histidine kinase
LKSKEHLRKEEQFSRLRAQAEQVFNIAADHSSPAPKQNFDAIFQDLQIMQLELEMQNDELHLANELLEIERLKFAGIYDLAPVGYFILNQQAVINQVNAVGAKMLEAGKGSIEGKKLMQFVAPDHRDIFFSFFEQLPCSGGQHSAQFKFISRSGREFYARAEGCAIGSASQCYIAIMDMTENIRTHLQLTEISERLQLAMDTSAALTWELHLPSMHFYLDARKHDICFIEPDRFDKTYSSFMALIHPDDQFMVDQHFRTAINARTEIDIICRFVGATDQVHFAHIRGRLIDTSVPASLRFVGIIWDITQKKVQEERAEVLRIDRQREITAAALYAEENERKRISEALHDSVSQLLYGVKLQLSEKNYAEAFAKANKLLDTAIQETRNISFQLAPSILADFGLAATINELCRRLSTPHVQIDAQISGFSAPGELFLEETIFRIIQELVNNCMKHSGATYIQISLKKDKLIEVLVTDNGKGFKYDNLAKPPKGAGLISVRNRLALYNGKLDISSAPGQGTTVRVQLTVG